MRILTIVKQVPDSNASIKLKPDGSDIELGGLKLVLDPFDEFGVELGIQLREKRSDVSEVVALTLGPDKAAEALRVALAMGADSGVHINDPAFESKNELFAAQVVAEAVKKDATGFDLILCGKYNIDLDAGAFGPALAEFLDIPHIAALQGLDVSDDGKSLVGRRRIEGAEEVVECVLPALLTIEKGMVEPRYPSLPNLMKAKKKPVAVLTSAELPVDGGLKAGLSFESIAAPPPREACKFVDGEPEDMAKELVRLLREEAKVV
ncbi:MAG: electron transfer flavoprotein subunit beta/FixA family protein [Planctomycetota bacterium]